MQRLPEKYLGPTAISQFLHAPLYFPLTNSIEWASTTPQIIGWNTANQQPLYDYLAAQDTRAFIVLKDGKIVMEKYVGKTFNNTAPFAQNMGLGRENPHQFCSGQGSTGRLAQHQR